MFFFSALALCAAQPPMPLKALAKWPLPTTFGVLNHTDHLIHDQGRVFASAKNLNIVFVLDEASGAVLRALPVEAPQGQGVSQDGSGRRLLWVGSDNNGILNAFDLATFERVYALNFSLAPGVGEADDLL
jgi:hypothetical protein